MRPSRGIVAACLSLAACAAPRQQSSAAEEAALLDLPDEVTVAAAPAAPEDGAVPPRVACYFGELMVARADESASNQGALLVKLTLDPARSRMLQETWSFPLYERYDITRTIDGASFTSSQDDGAFTGSGTLDGQPWIWSGWSATTTSADRATRVESATQFVDGALVTRETVRNGDGTVRVELHHELDEVPLDECERMFAKARVNADKLRAAATAP